MSWAKTLENTMNMISDLRHRFTTSSTGTVVVNVDEFNRLQREWITRNGAEDMVAAERERWEPVAWQQRYLCPEEGPSIWQHCNDSDAAILSKRTDYELRRVYALRA
jgi:hypothetical protein